MLRCVLPGIALGLALLGSVLAAPAGPVASIPLSTLAAQKPATRIQGEACTEACRRAHTNCLISEKGSPRCNARLQRCLQACLAGRRGR